MCKHITVNGSSHEVVALVSSVAPLGAGQAMTARVISRLESGHGGLVRGGSIHAMAILGSWEVRPMPALDSRRLNSLVSSIEHERSTRTRGLGGRYIHP